MLYPDAEKRRKELTDIANNIFKDLGYPKTARETLAFAKIFKMNQVPPDFFTKWHSLFEIVQEEFASKLPYLQDYRRKYFKEISDTVISGLSKLSEENLLVIRPFGKGLRNAMKIVGDISDKIVREEIKDKTLVFHLFCYRYLIIVEGIIDELARLFYFFATAPNPEINEYSDLEKISIWKIRDQLNPIFLHGFDKWKHIRNAIGHARVYFNYEDEKVRFTDIEKGKVTFDETLPVSVFIDMEFEVERVLTAFYLIWILLNIYNLIASRKTFL